jgi:hypothetical protein
MAEFWTALLQAMEAARADEEAAARMAAASSHSGSPRFHTPPDGPSILAHLAHSGALNGKVGSAVNWRDDGACV